MNEAEIVRYVDGGPDECRRAAIDWAADAGREALAVRIFRQGTRLMLTGALPINRLLRVLEHNPAPKRATVGTALWASNRPVDPKHVNNITDYVLRSIREQRPFILPPMTLNASAKDMVLFAPKGATGPVTGWAVLPDEQRISVTDGQHRYLALKKVADELRGTEEGVEFLSNGVAVMITLSDSPDQVHQDFADAAKTKPLPPSLVAVYDLRHPGNRAVLQLIERVPLFRGRIDATSTTLSINSPYLFLVNQVRQFVKATLTGNPSIKDDAFFQQAENALTNNEAFEQWLQSRVAFLEICTELITEWQEIANLPPPGGPEGHVVLVGMKQIRERQPVCLSASALIALGVVSHVILHRLMPTGKAPIKDEVRRVLSPLNTIDWTRNAAIWSGNLVVDGNIKTQTTNVRRAAEKILEALNIPPARPPRAARAAG